MFPLNNVFSNKEATGRIAKWEMKLTSFYIMLTGKTSIKFEILVDFEVKLQAPVTPLTKHPES